MITTEDITRAEADEAKVRERAGLLRLCHNIDGGESTERARRHVEEMRERKERQDAALKERATTVKAAGPELKKLAAGAEKSSQTVVDAAQEAVGALRRLMAAADAHEGAMGAVHARLEELGLPLGDDACSEYPEGAGEGGAVRLGGRTYGPVATDVVMTAVVAALAKAEYGPQHTLAQSVHSARQHVVSQQAAARELLARLP